MEKKIAVMPFFVICAAMVLLPGCGSRRVKYQPVTEVACADTPVDQAPANPMFVFDDSMETFVLDEDNTPAMPASQLAFDEPVLDFDWNAIETNEGNMVTVYYPFDGRNPSKDQAENIAKLDAIAQELYQAGKQICLKGKCDQFGNKSYNMALSQTRAMNMKKHLVEELHIPESAIRTFGVGNEEAVAYEMTIEAQAPNRCVEMYGLAA